MSFASNPRQTLQPGGAPRPYLEERTRLRVRFSEVDAMQVVWHGHYVNYFEDARRAFGRRYGLDYPVFFQQNVAAPVVRLEVDYLAPARLADELEVIARLLKTEAARLEFDYEIRRVGEERLLVCGRSVQVFTSPAGELLLAWPPFMIERLRSWEPLWKQP
jgi:acyl-CoA thioester hydrolase